MLSSTTLKYSKKINLKFQKVTRFITVQQHGDVWVSEDLENVTSPL